MNFNEAFKAMKMDQKQNYLDGAVIGTGMKKNRRL